MKKIFGVILTMALTVCLVLGDSMAVSAKETVYYPKEISDVLTNPYMGWVGWATNTNVKQPVTMVYAALLWSELEPNEKGTFDWKSFETKNNFDYWRSQGVKINIRFYMDLPSGTAHKDIPQWLYDAMGSDKGTAYDCAEIGKGFSPNYSDATLRKEHKRVIAALGARYNNDPSIAFIQLGSLGHWGEWHCWPYKDSNATGVFPSQAVSDEYIDHYLAAFSADKLCMRRSTAKAGKNGMGLFNDMFGDSASLYSSGWGWLNQINNGYTDDIGQSQPSMQEFWKNGPSGGEFANGNAAQYLSAANFTSTLQQAMDSHTSWLGPCSPAYDSDSAIQKNMDTLLKTIGYRFVLTSISHADTATAGSTVKVNMNWANKGVAPFYFNWSVRIGLANKNGVVTYSKVSTDLREWFPGSKSIAANLKIPSNVKDGEYTVVVAMIDPATGEPGINLAIAGKRSDGWYALDTIKVSGSSGSGSSGSGSSSGSIDWSTITPVTKSSSQSATAVKVTNDSNYLYMRIEGTNLGAKSQIYLDADNKKTSGYLDPNWISAGMDYMIEGSKLYAHKTNDSNWTWTRVTDVDFTVNNQGSYIDVKISRKILEGTIAFTFKDVDGNYKVVSTLPWKGNYAYYAMK